MRKDKMMPDKIQMTDLKAQYGAIKPEIDAAIQSIFNESSFIQGKQVGLFEEEIARYFAVKFAVGVASGTDALVLALAALGIAKADEVITTPFTFIATAEAISRVGATPVFCDIDYRSYNIDANKIEEKITSKTKAIIPVHLYGLPCDMSKIMSLAAKHKLKVIEDCAQSFGSEYKNKKVGSFGDCGCLSFFPAKTLGCYGDGGMIVTNIEEIAKKAKILRNHGSVKKYLYGMHGFNSRLDTIQAAILRVKLKHIDSWINKRIDNARYYNELFSQNKDIIPPELENLEYKHTFNYYTIRIKGNMREKVQNYLNEKSIPSAIYYPLSLHLQEIYKNLPYKIGSFPISEQAQEEVLSLPMYPELNKIKIQEIASSIKQAL